ncbi:MAG: hypothetical protein RJS97_02610 [Parvibaculaceae bacterium]
MPRIEHIAERRKRLEADPICLHLEAFLEECAMAADVRILDRFFDTDSAEILVEAINKAPNLRTLRILTKSDLVEDCRTCIAGAKPSPRDRSTRPSMEIRGLYKARYQNAHWESRLHDRFAITDGELWHFGANVMGNHEGLNACSRGWNDADIKFHELFDQIWKDCRNG